MSKTVKTGLPPDLVPAGLEPDGLAAVDERARDGRRHGAGGASAVKPELGLDHLARRVRIRHLERLERASAAEAADDAASRAATATMTLLIMTLLMLRSIPYPRVEG